MSELASIAKPVTDEELKDVATVSAGGNEKARSTLGSALPWLSRRACLAEGSMCTPRNCASPNPCAPPLRLLAPGSLMLALISTTDLSRGLCRCRLAS